MLCCKNFSRVHCFFSDHYQRADNAHVVGCVSPCPKSAFTSHHRSALICFTNTKKSIGLLQNRADWYNSLSHSPQMTKSSLLTTPNSIGQISQVTFHQRLCEMRLNWCRYILNKCSRHPPRNCKEINKALETADERSDKNCTILIRNFFLLKSQFFCLVHMYHAQM